MSLVNYGVIELTLTILCLVFSQKETPKKSSAPLHGTKTWEMRQKKRVVRAPMVGAITGPRGRGVNDNYVTINDTYRWQYCLTIQIHPYWKMVSPFGREIWLVMWVQSRSSGITQSSKNYGAFKDMVGIWCHIQLHSVGVAVGTVSIVVKCSKFLIAPGPMKTADVITCGSSFTKSFFKQTT